MKTNIDAAAVLRKIREALQLANDDENGPITDTIWMPGVGCQTMFDYIDEAIDEAERAAIPDLSQQLKEAQAECWKRGARISELESERAAIQPAGTRTCGTCYGKGVIYQCVICGAGEPHTGTCGSDDPRALCTLAAPISEGAAKGDATIEDLKHAVWCAEVNLDGAREHLAECLRETPPVDGYQHDSHTAEHLATVLGITPAAPSGSTCAAINPPEFPAYMADFCASMSKQDVWDYACLTGWRAARTPAIVGTIADDAEFRQMLAKYTNGWQEGLKPSFEMYEKIVAYIDAKIKGARNAQN